MSGTGESRIGELRLQTLTTSSFVAPAPKAEQISHTSSRTDSPVFENTSGSTLNAMTVDVEDFFQVSAFEKYIDRSNWSMFDCRVEANVDQILDLFDQHQIRATFFTLGWVAIRYPSMIERIVSAGHELASHGWDHKMVINLDRTTFLEDISRTKSLLENLSGTAVRGYRAPSYSINSDNAEWAHESLVEAGYEYSSSIAPIVHDLYGMPEAPRFKHMRCNDQILEIPITTVEVGNRNLPCGGGGWFRLYPYRLSRWAINQVNEVGWGVGGLLFSSLGNRSTTAAPVSS